MADVQIPAGPAVLEGNLIIPDNATALVLFVPGSGSSRHSRRNQFVARKLNEAELATLLFDLLTPEEESIDMYTREHRFNISLLAERLVHATNWATQQKQTRALGIGYFASSTGGGAALVAAAKLPDKLSAVVSRGGPPRFGWRSIRGAGTDITHRRRRRRRGDRVEQTGDETHALRSET
jgi:putative phosphoribosyl transferase